MAKGKVKSKERKRKAEELASTEDFSKRAQSLHSQKNFQTPLATKYVPRFGNATKKVRQSQDSSSVLSGGDIYTQPTEGLEHTSYCKAISGSQPASNGCHTDQVSTTGEEGIHKLWKQPISDPTLASPKLSETRYTSSCVPGLTLSQTASPSLNIPDLEAAEHTRTAGRKCGLIRNHHTHQYAVEQSGSKNNEHDPSTGSGCVKVSTEGLANDLSQNDETDHKNLKLLMPIDFDDNISPFVVDSNKIPVVEQLLLLNEPTLPVEQPLLVNEPAPPVEQPLLVNESTPPVEQPLLVNEPTPPVEQPLLVNEPAPPVEQPLLVNESTPPVEQPLLVNEPTPPVKQPLLVNESTPPVEQPLLVNESTPPVEQSLLVKESTPPVEQPLLVNEPTPPVEQPLLINEPIPTVEQPLLVIEQTSPVEQPLLVNKPTDDATLPDSQELPADSAHIDSLYEDTSPWTKSPTRDPSEGVVVNDLSDTTVSNDNHKALLSGEELTMQEVLDLEAQELYSSQNWHTSAAITPGSQQGNWRQGKHQSEKTHKTSFENNRQAPGTDGSEPVLKGLISEISSINQFIVRCKRELESARKQRNTWLKSSRHNMNHT